MIKLRQYYMVKRMMRQLLEIIYEWLERLRERLALTIVKLQKMKIS